MQPSIPPIEYFFLPFQHDTALPHAQEWNTVVHYESRLATRVVFNPFHVLE